MFEKEARVNYKATGVCYNNIANYFVKNSKFRLAIHNYRLALTQIDKQEQRIANEVPLLTDTQRLDDHLGGAIDTRVDTAYFSDDRRATDPDKSNRRQQNLYYKKVRAHRNYQLAICMYKQQKYEGVNSELNSSDLDLKAWKDTDTACYNSIQEYSNIQQTYD